MAKYKYGQNELDLQNLITNLSNNVDSYIQSKTDWSQAQKESFKEGYHDYIAGLQDQLANDTGRFSADEFGTITDKEGKLKDNTSTDYVYNKKGELLDPMTTSEKKLKKGTPFYRNQELAIFNNIIAKGMLDKMNEQQKDIPSLADYWQQQYNPKGDLADYASVAALDKEGDYTNRIAEIKGLYNSYKQKYKLSPEQTAKYDALINSLNTNNVGSDEWKNQIIRNSAAAGVGKFFTGYLGFNVPKPEKPFDINNDEDVIKRYQLEEKIKSYPELRDTLIANARADYNKDIEAALNQEEANNKKIAQEQYNKKLDEFYKQNPGVYDVNLRKTQDFGGLSLINDKLASFVNKTSGKGWNDNVNTTLNIANRKGDYFNTKFATPISLKGENGKKYTIYNLGQFYSLVFPYLKNNNLLTDFDRVEDKAGNEVYRLKGSQNQNGEWLYMFIGRNKKLKTYRSKSYKDILPKAQTGLKFQNYYGKQQEQQTAATKARAKATGKTYQQQKTADTVTTKWTPQDDARILGTIADIGSMGAAFIPGGGTLISAGLGLGSTAANLYADLTDGTMSTWDAVKNAGVNIGFDTIGLLGGAGKLGKIGATVLRYAPRVLAAVGTAQGIENAPQITASYKKMMNQGFSSLTPQEWQYISQGLGILTGLGGGTVRKVKNHIKATEHTWDQVGLYMNKKGTKNKTMFTFKGEDAKAIRNAKNDAEIKAVTDKYTKLRGYELSPSTKISRPHLAKIGRNKETGEFNFNPFSMKSDKVQLYDIYQDKRGNTYANKEGIRGWLQPYSASKNHIWNHEVNNYIPKTQQLNIPKVRKKVQPKSIDSEIRAAENERAANQSLYDEYKTALGMRQQAMKENKVDDLQTANDLLKKAINNIRGKQTAYNKLRETLKHNQNLVYTDTSNKQVQASWKDILSKYKIGYKQGGVIKAQAGTKTPWYSTLKAVNKDTDFISDWDTSTLYAGDTRSGLKNPWTSNQPGHAAGRYTPTTGYNREQAVQIEKDPLYSNFINNLFNKDGTFNKIGESWARKVDELIPRDSLASFYDPKTDKLRKQWVTTNNDIYNNKPAIYTNLKDYVSNVMNDNIIGARHNIFIKKGKRYYYTDESGNKVYVNPQDLSKYKVSDKSNDSFENGTLWSEYELTGFAPEAGKTTAALPTSTTKKANIDYENLINSISPTRTYGLARAIAAERNNNKMLEASYTQPLLQSPMEVHRNIYSDLASEIQGQKEAAALQRLAASQAGSDFDRNTAMALDAKLKGIELKDQRFKASNDLQRQSAEASWAQEKENKQNRWQTNTANRTAAYENNLNNLQRKLATQAQNFQIWDTYNQQLQQEAATDWQVNRARMDTMAENDITNAIKHNIRGYIPNISTQDEQLWNDVQSGRKSTSTMTPIESARFRTISEQANQAKYEQLRQYYKMPKNKWSNYTIKTPYTPTISKNGGKLQVARLRAATADADRFYKTTKDFADRTERAIARLNNKKKKKKQ